MKICLEENELSDLLDAVSIAIFFDAEGNVSLYPIQGHRGRHGFTVNSLLVITNNSYDVLEWIQSILGGKICQMKEKGRGTRRKPTYRLMWNNYEDILTVIDCLEFGGTRIKTEHISIMKQYILSRLETTRYWQSAPYTKEELYLVKRVMDLNRRIDKVYVGDGLIEEALKNGY